MYERISLLHHFALPFIVTILIRSSFNSHNHQHHSHCNDAINITRKAGDRCHLDEFVERILHFLFFFFPLRRLALTLLAVVFVAVAIAINSFATRPQLLGIILNEPHT